MKLSELKTGEQGIIVDIKGQGSFRKRIIEMGFIHNKIAVSYTHLTLPTILLV